MVWGLNYKGRMCKPGDIQDFPDDYAQKLIDRQVAKPLEAQVEVSAVDPRTEKAMKGPRRKGK